MCAIAGCVVASPFFASDLLVKMNNLQKHRGADDEGYFLYHPDTESFYASGNDSPPEIKAKYPSIHSRNFTHTLAFAHRRYAVQDLSSDGRQPFTFRNLTLVYHGEIFNFRDIKAELQKTGYSFQTNCDTETLLIAFYHWGTDAFIRLNGLFSVAIFDKNAKTLTLSRDQIGKAPLYYSLQKEAFYFATEIKPLLEANKSLRKGVNPVAVGDYLQYGIRDFNNQTFWSGVQSLPAGSFGVYDLKTCGLTVETYWSFPRNRLKIADISLPVATSRFKMLLADALDLRTQSDLPFGFTLSGGLDSSALVGLYASGQPAGEKKTPCYTVRFDNPAYNEEPYARKVFEKYESHLDYCVVDGLQESLTGELDYFFNLAEEPFHSPNLYTEHLLLKLLKSRGIGVNINGAGGDELLAGYEMEYQLVYMKFLLQNFPLDYAKEFISQLFYHPAWRRKASVVYQNALIWSRVSKKETANPAKEFLTCYPRILTLSGDFNERMIQNFSDFKMNYWMRSGNKHYFGVPVEPRNPFLDVRLVEYCFQLPPQYLIHNGWHKYILRKAVEPILPPEIVWRKYKMGFPFNLPQWLKDSKNQLTQPLTGKNIPYIDAPKVINSYDRLVLENPALLWRLICYSLWHIKMIEQNNLFNGKL